MLIQSVWGRAWDPAFLAGSQRMRALLVPNRTHFGQWGFNPVFLWLEVWKLLNSVSDLVRVYSSGHVWMWELHYKESWAPKNWCFWTVVLEKTLESPLGCREIQPVHPKGNHSWMFIGRTDVEAETPVLWPPDVKSWLIWKDPDAGKDWGREEEGDDRGGGGWMASPTQWTWVWVNSRSWRWMGRPVMLQSMGSQRVGHNWATELSTASLSRNNGFNVAACFLGQPWLEVRSCIF